MDSVNFLNLEYVFLRIFDLFKNFDVVAIVNWIIHYINLIKPFAIVVSLFMFYVIIYSKIRLGQVMAEHEANFHDLKPEEKTEPMPDAELAAKWKKVLAHINSSNPSDWRLAILEADIMLGEMLEKMGFQGDTIGDQLKSIDKSDFISLPQAWEAHRIRNQIAHEGTDFQLNEREAKRVIDLYKSVFSEFYHI